MPLDNRIESLNLKFQPIAQAWLEVVKAYILPARWPGYKVRITETKRDGARQEAVLAAGASTLKVGYHNYGLAFDYAVMDDHGVLITDGKHPVYLACGQAGEALGCVWGGRWVTFPDAGHLEFHPGMHLDEVIANGGLRT